MSSKGHVTLFGFPSSQTSIQPSKKKALSPCVSIVLTLLAAMVLAAAAGGAAYALTHQIVPVAASAGATFLGVNVLAFIILRCFQRKTESTPQTSAASPLIPKKTSQGLISSQITQTQPPTPSILIPSPSTSTTTKDTHTFLQQLAKSKPPTGLCDLNIQEATSGTQMSYLEVCRRVLLLMNTPSKDWIAEFTKALFAQLATQKNDAQTIENIVIPAIQYFSQTTIQAIADGLQPFSNESSCFTVWQIFEDAKIASSFVSSANKSSQLKLVSKKSNARRIAHNLLLTQALKTGQDGNSKIPLLEAYERFGLAIDGGLCFYHACAQALSVALKKTITMKDIGTKIKQFAESMPKETFENEYLCLRKPALSYADYMQNLNLLIQGKVISDTWGDQFLDGLLISKLYQVRLYVSQAVFKQKKETLVHKAESLEEEDEEEEISVNDLTQPPHVSITIHRYDEVQLDAPIVKIAALNDQHFDPVLPVIL